MQRARVPREQLQIESTFRRRLEVVISGNRVAICEPQNRCKTRGNDSPRGVATRASEVVVHGGSVPGEARTLGNERDYTGSVALYADPFVSLDLYTADCFILDRGISAGRDFEPRFPSRQHEGGSREEHFVEQKTRISTKRRNTYIARRNLHYETVDRVIDQLIDYSIHSVSISLHSKVDIRRPFSYAMHAGRSFRHVFNINI